MNDIRPPKPPTLKKYGLTEADWFAILEAQGNVCAICKKEPPSGRFCVDHEHVTRWKKLPPERRRQTIRGILCWTCNHYYVGRGITIQKAHNVVSYLERYAQKGEPPF